jgi:hypothetical protein
VGVHATLGRKARAMWWGGGRGHGILNTRREYLTRIHVKETKGTCQDGGIIGSCTTRRNSWHVSRVRNVWHVERGKNNLHVPRGKKFVCATFRLLMGSCNVGGKVDPVTTCNKKGIIATCKSSYYNFDTCHESATTCRYPDSTC